jgi:hypothetical protein
MAVILTQGTVEYLIVTVTDLLGQVSDLTGSSPTFQVFRDKDDFEIMTDVVATPQLMDLYCLVDTTQGSGLTTPEVPFAGWWSGKSSSAHGGDYRLYVKCNIGAEIPRLGPFLFTVDDS